MAILMSFDMSLNTNLLFTRDGSTDRDRQSKKQHTHTQSRIKHYIKNTC